MRIYGIVDLAFIIFLRSDSSAACYPPNQDYSRELESSPYQNLIVPYECYNYSNY